MSEDVVRCYHQTMEGANEAARRAVNAILLAIGSRQKPCQIWPLRQPMLLAPLRAIDWLGYQFKKKTPAPR